MTPNLQTSSWGRRVFRYAPLVLWIGLIMFLSSGQASMSKTSLFVRPILEFLFPNAPEEILVVYHGYVRKLAHITVYAALAFWACRAFSTSARNLLVRFWYIAAFALVVVVAVVDEINQSYISSRTGSIYDVFLDTAGGLTMIVIFYVVLKLRKNKAI